MQEQAIDEPPPSSRSPLTTVGASMVIKGYKWLFKKVLRRLLARELAWHGHPSPAGGSSTLVEVNRAYIAERVHHNLELAMVQAKNHTWLFRIFNTFLMLNIIACACRLVEWAAFTTHYAQIASMGVTIATLGVVFWGTCVLHRRLTGMMDDREMAAGQREEPAAPPESETHLFIGAVTTITVFTLLVTLNPNAMATVGLLPAVVMTFFLSGHRAIRDIITPDLSSAELREYLQHTQSLYTGEVLDNVFFRELEGTPTTISYLLQHQVEPRQDTKEISRTPDLEQYHSL